MIARGLTDGDSNRARKAYARLMETLPIQEDRVAQEHNSINFEPEDMVGVAFPYSDALVIELPSPIMR